MKTIIRFGSKFWLPALLLVLVVFLFQWDGFAIWKSIHAINATKWSPRTSLAANAAVLITLSFIRWRPNIVRFISCHGKARRRGAGNNRLIRVTEEIV